MGTLVDAYSSFNWLDGLVRGHPSAMKDSPGWAGAGLGADFVGLMQPLAAAGGEAFGATRIAEAAATPIIAAALVTMMGMSNSCGFGSPNDGWQFASGSDEFKKASDSLQGTKPPGSWQGGASDNYGSRNEEHQHRVAGMAEVDASVKKALADEAEQVTKTRDTLDHMQTILGLSIVPAVAALAAPPPFGEAASMTIQLAAVAGTLPFALDGYSTLIANASRNSTAIEQATAQYAQIASTSKP